MSFSSQQMKILVFPYSKYDALICDGAIRSGKTSIMSVAFVDWAMRNFNTCNFAICGKTVGSAVKNVVVPFISLHNSKQKYSMKFNRADNRLTVTQNGKTNFFYIYGGKDESSYMLIQGITLAGVLLDEVVLMTQSFVQQALARCSVSGSKFWFSCNPGNPKHWFHEEWVSKAKEKNALYVHFELRDNPSLTEQIIERYENMYTGVFYERYIRGRWVAAEGVIYRQFADSPDRYQIDVAPYCPIVTIGVDFGGNGSANTFNCTGFANGMRDVIALDEYYRKEIISPTQLENDFVEFVQKCRDKYTICDVYCDSAEQTLIRGLKTAAAKAGLPVQIHNARKGEIIDRIRFFNRLIGSDRFKIMRSCTHTIDALSSAVWDKKHITEDVRLDDGSYNVDSLDSLEYSAEPYMKQILARW